MRSTLVGDGDITTPANVMDDGAVNQGQSRRDRKKKRENGPAEAENTTYAERLGVLFAPRHVLTDSAAAERSSSRFSTRVEVARGSTGCGAELPATAMSCFGTNGRLQLVPSASWGAPREPIGSPRGGVRRCRPVVGWKLESAPAA